MIVRTLTLPVLLLLALPAYAADKDSLSDTQIQSAVERELSLQPAVSSLELDATVKNGVVTLTGSAEHLAAQDRAVDVAQRVKGVMSVVDKTTLEVPPRSDAEILADTDAELVLKPAVNSLDVTIMVNDGVVTLDGKVNSYQERHLAAEQAETVRGVIKVDNNIAVETELARTELDIRKDVEQALAWNVAIDDALIRVDVNNDRVVLKGTVGSAAERDHAERLAWVRGVQDIKNKLEVEWWARDERLRKSSTLDQPDSAIESAVGRAMVQDPAVLASTVETDVQGGYVTLTGTATTLSQKMAAERAARNTVGVWGVENLVKVRPEQIYSEANLEDRIEDSFARDPWLVGYDLDVQVNGAQATLIGEVPTAWDQARAVELASEVSGVTYINEHIQVDTLPDGVWVDPVWSGWSYVDRTDEEIEKRIEDHVYWNPYLESEDVTVRVEDERVRLTGTVDTWYERYEATQEALAGGAEVVDNDLQVAFGPSTVDASDG